MCVSVMYAPFLTIVLIWTSSLSIKDLFGKDGILFIDKIILNLSDCI